MSSQHPRHKPVTLSVREDVLLAAKALGLNISQAAEAGVSAAVREAQQEAWLRDNAQAITDYNAKVLTRGLVLTPRWAKP